MIQLVMKQYEYKTSLLLAKATLSKRLETGKVEKELNRYGQDGWELVSCVPALPCWGAEGGILVVMKREIGGGQQQKKLFSSNW